VLWLMWYGICLRHIYGFFSLIGSISCSPGLISRNCFLFRGFSLASAKELVSYIHGSLTFNTGDILSFVEIKQNIDESQYLKSASALCCGHYLFLIQFRL